MTLRNDTGSETDMPSPFDHAVADRLAKLRTMPVDTSRLDAALRAALPPPPVSSARAAAAGMARPAGPAAADRFRGGWFRPVRPLRAFAASLVLTSAVAAVVLLTASGGPALASPTEMARMHDELVSGRVPVVRVESIGEAGRALNQQWPDRPDLPDAPESHVMACCMKSVKDKRVACVLLKSEGVPITMTVARAADMRLPTSPTVSRNNVTYHVQAAGDLTMVMTERDGRWVCLIGQLPAERLMDVAARLQF